MISSGGRLKEKQRWRSVRFLRFPTALTACAGARVLFVLAAEHTAEVADHVARLAHEPADCTRAARNRPVNVPGDGRRQTLFQEADDGLDRRARLRLADARLRNDLID